MSKDKVVKADLALRISERTGLSRKQSAEVVSTAAALMVEALKGGQTVGLLGLGTFSISHTIQRQGVRPGTTERITIPAGKKVRFKMSTGLKESL